MDNVVYFLGAGFSAPLGLPVTSNFLIKSKDMYAENAQRYEHFSEVFKQIKELSIIKNYYNADLFNIEEILSILDMGEHLEGRKLGEVFLRYITDVIQYTRPRSRRIHRANSTLTGMTRRLVLMTLGTRTACSLEVC